MSLHTHEKSHYAVACGRFVQFFMRAPANGKIKYRKPVLHHTKWRKNKKEIQRLIKQWERVLS